MNTTWQRWSRRVDGMSLRERVFLFLCLALLMIGVADQAVIAPALRSQREAQGPLSAGAGELSALRSQLMSLSQAASAADDSASSPARLQRALGQAAAERQALLARLHPQGVPGMARGAALPELLNQVLQRHGRLTLESLSTRPAASAASAPQPSGPDAGWQSAELRVSGPYPELQRFIVALETGLPGLQWGELRLDTQPGPPVLSVTVWLAGAQP